MKNNILKHPKNLKSADPVFARIYLKRDVHPSMRKEWKRLFKSLKSESAKPENSGCDITTDKKKTPNNQKWDCYR